MSCVTDLSAPSVSDCLSCLRPSSECEWRVKFQHPDQNPLHRDASDWSSGLAQSYTSAGASRIKPPSFFALFSVDYKNQILHQEKQHKWDPITKTETTLFTSLSIQTLFQRHPRIPAKTSTILHRIPSMFRTKTRLSHRQALLILIPKTSGCMKWSLYPTGSY